MNNYGSTDTQSNSDSFTTFKIPAKRQTWSWSLVFTVVSAVALIGVLVTLAVTITINPDSTEIEITDVLKAGEETPATTRRSWRRNRQPSVRLSQGRLRGTVLQSRGGRDYNAFYTVPYGAPPVGSLRFQPPQPAEGWSRTRDATQKGPMCVQQERYNPNVTIVGDEDCLYVHIFTPKIPGFFERSKFPVIAYFFGGGFMHGTANDFGGDYFLDEDVVIVLVESRVGALGFLNTGDLEITGNQGLKDQTLALKWIQDNISKFGGDAKKVVAFGTSSGAACSHAHLFSPMTSGLVSGIMSFSGTFIGPEQSIETNPRKQAMDLGQAIGCANITDSKSLVDCLQNATAEEIGLGQADISFMPTIEPVPLDGNLNQTFLTESPIALLKSGRFNKVPWMTGVNSAESILESYNLLLDPEQVSNLNENWDSVIPEILMFQDTPTNDISHEIREFYFGNESVSNSTRFNLTNMLSDRIHVHPAKTSAVLQAKQNSTVFMYYLTKEANVSYARDVTQYFEPPYGVSHADEVQYFFPRPRYPYIPLDSEWAEFSKMFVRLIVAFANNSAPASLDQWPPVDPEASGTVFYNLDDVPKLVEPINERMELWDSFPIDVLYNETISKDVQTDADAEIDPVVNGDTVPQLNVDTDRAENVDTQPGVNADTIIPQINGFPKPTVNTNNPPVVNVDTDSRVNTDAQPAPATNNPPVVNVDTKPSVTVDAKPSVNAESKPAVTIDIKPLVNFDTISTEVVNTDKKPGVNFDESSLNGTNRSVSIDSTLSINSEPKASSKIENIASAVNVANTRSDNKENSSSNVGTIPSSNLNPITPYY